MPPRPPPPAFLRAFSLLAGPALPRARPSCPRPAFRFFSSDAPPPAPAPPRVTVSHAPDGITTIAMAAKPVNALSAQVMAELRDAFAKLKYPEDGGAPGEGTTRGIVLTSALGPKVFSAGLDLPFLMGLQNNAADKAKLGEYLGLLKELVLAIRTAPVPTVAAVNGVAPAGGTMLMLLCDYRIAVDDDKITIGLSEVSVGITVPAFLAQLAEETMGPHRTDRHLQLGRLLTPNAALLHSLVDETCPDHDSLQDLARQRCLEYLAVPHRPRALTKRRSTDMFVAAVEDGHEDFVEGLWEDVTREGEGSFRDIVGKMMSRGKK
ncbi:ClpP/crotonase-like domain-containing protein [Hyaloraphidium curvatum]|nr:ClpP/crotonase-like domain-containing protein [Hyaloraphidium curvatum]